MTNSASFDFDRPSVRGAVQAWRRKLRAEAREWLLTLDDDTIASLARTGETENLPPAVAQVG
jgi:hypothetical protein